MGWTKRIWGFRHGVSGRKKRWSRNTTLVWPSSNHSVSISGSIFYRHHLIAPDVDPAKHRGLDLATAETWKKWGLNRWQLTAAGAAAGGIAGAAFDLGVGLHSLGAGTVIGALGGGTAAFFKGGQLPELKVKLGGGVKWKAGEGRTLSIGPPASQNFPWVLLDSMLVRYRGNHFEGPWSPVIRLS